MNMRNTNYGEELDANNNEKQTKKLVDVDVRQLNNNNQNNSKIYLNLIIHKDFFKRKVFNEYFN